MLNEILRRVQIKNWGGCAINSRTLCKSKTVAVCLKTVVGYQKEQSSIQTADRILKTAYYLKNGIHLFSKNSSST